MVVSSKPNPVRVRLRLFWWAVMLASVFWTLLYHVAQKDSEIPEFVYVNF